MTAPPRDAFLLVTHGSRDPRPDAAAAQLAQALSRHLKASTPPDAATRHRSRRPLVESAALECGDRPLHEQILQVSDQLLASDATRLKIVPLFLLAGVHVTEDVPEEVNRARHRLNGDIALQLTPHLGQSPLMRSVLERQLQRAETAPPPQGGRILLSHGSRRPGGNDTVIALARQLQASAAYWSVAPQLDETVAGFVRAGHHRITILPYFLFPGSITDAIAQQVGQLRQRFPQIELHLAPLLSESAEFETLVAEVMGLGHVFADADLTPCHFH